MIGFTLGKFRIPHIGHKYMIDFGSQLYDTFYIIVGGKESDKIPLSQRVEWLEDEYKNTNIKVIPCEDNTPVVQLDENGVAPDDYLDLWVDIFNEVLPEKPDGMVTGEIYGKHLAEKMNIEWFAPDNFRGTFPISASMIELDISSYFDYIMKSAQPYFNTHIHIAIVGPESSGKSTISKYLAKLFNGVCIPEYGRTLSEIRGLNLSENDFNDIVRGQTALNNIMKNDVIFNDTEFFTTYLFAKIYLNKDLEYIKQLGIEQKFDKYIVLAPTVQWVQDGNRILNTKDKQWDFFNNLIYLLDKYKKDYVVIDNKNFTLRTETCIDIVEDIL